MYAIDYNDYKDYKIRKYGFHGTSHKYVSQEAIKYLGKKAEDTKIFPHCYNKINIKADRCPYCTSKLNESIENIKNNLNK